MAQRWQLRALLVACVARASEGLCPQGFGGTTSFPKEWKIPPWPKDMPLEQAALLNTVTMGGFKNEALNEEYLEGPGAEFTMQGRETYWQASGKYVLYYCQRFSKWRIAEISAFGQNKDGDCFAFVSDGFPSRDIRNTSLIKGWIEVEGERWVQRPDAGVVAVGKLGDQMQSDAEDEADEDTPADGNCDSEVDADGNPFATKGEKKSNCPVMPVVRKAKEKVVEASKAAGKWARRLFPKLLGAPDEEDAIPEGEEGEGIWASDGATSCDVVTKDGCTFKEKFYIERQQNTTAEKRRAELTRLAKIKDVSMKPAQQDWLMKRLGILGKLVTKDEL